MKPLRYNLFAILVVAFSSCKKSENNCSLVPLKVIRYDCERIVMQVLSPDVIGDSSWTDVFTGETYTNVVSYYNTCQIASITNGEFQTLYANMEKTNEYLWPDDCVQCLGISPYPPKTMVKLTNISTNSCYEW